MILLIYVIKLTPSQKKKKKDVQHCDIQRATENQLLRTIAHTKKIVKKVLLDCLKLYFSIFFYLTPLLVFQKPHSIPLFKKKLIVKFL